jgi:cyclophilin family peptidyl-prolyl cis-trans isomerase
MMRRFFALIGVLFFMTSTEVLADNPKVLFKTNHGDITVELFADKAPKTVANFLTYVKEGHYNGTIFHRVIKDFMIQGGGFTADMTQKPVHEPIENEADNGLRNTIGTLAMARTNDPHSATAQFFINTVNNDFLDFREKTPRAWGYAVFGRVIDGMKTVNEIRSVATGNKGMYQDVPKEPVIIQEAHQL